MSGVRASLATSLVSLSSLSLSLFWGCVCWCPRPCLGWCPRAGVRASLATSLVSLSSLFLVFVLGVRVLVSTSLPKGGVLGQGCVRHWPRPWSLCRLFLCLCFRGACAGVHVPA